MSSDEEGIRRKDVCLPNPATPSDFSFQFNDDDDNELLNSNDCFNYYSRSVAPQIDFEVDFSSTFNRDGEVEEMADIQSVLPIVNNICSNPDTTVLAAFGNFGNYDTYIPFSDYHPTLNPSSPSQNKTSITDIEVNKQTLTPTKKGQSKKPKLQTSPLKTMELQSLDSHTLRKRKMDECPEKSTEMTLVSCPKSYKSSNSLGEIDVKFDYTPSASNQLEKSLIDFVEECETNERPGKLVRLKLKNFMCHEQFDEEWHKQLNYITADNGAGKSAILVALQLVFGAKAITTMRSTAVKDLIQHEKNRSTIDITLTNNGLLDIEKYGKEIGIIRTILWNGTSRYQIRTGDGKSTRSLPRKELELIKATLQIMVDNPAMILNQEASRNFLRSSDPRALYTYFYRGLNLEHCGILLERSKDDVKSAQSALESKNKLLEELQENAKKFKFEYDAVLSLEEGQDRAHKLNLEYYWAIVLQIDDEISTMESNYEDIVDKCKNLEEQLKSISDLKNSLKINQESSKSELKKLKKDLKQLRKNLEVKNREFHASRQELGTSNAKLTSINKIINEKTNKVKNIEAEILKIREENNAKDEEDLRQIQEQKTILENEKVIAKGKLVEAKTLKDEVYNKFDEFKQKEVEICERNEDIKFRIREKQHEVTNIQKKQDTKYNKYGTEMVKLIQEIEKMVEKNQFKEPPIGPQSACYTVKDEYKEFAPLIEHILGQTLFQFRVGHLEDKILFQKLTKKIYGKKSQPDILFHPMKNKEKYKLFDVKKSSGFDTVLDALDIIDDNPVVINWLVDSNQIERILLFKSERDACDVMKEVQRVPKGCRIGYTLNFKRIHADPQFRCMVINPMKTKTNYIQISSHVENDELLKNEIKELEAEGSEVEIHLEKAKQEVKKAEENNRKMDKKVTEAQQELNAIEASIQSLDDTVGQGTDIESYEEDAQELRMNIRENETKIKNLEIHIQSLKSKFSIAENEKSEVEDLVQNKESEIQEIENKGNYEKQSNDLEMKLQTAKDELINQNALKFSLEKKLKQTKERQKKAFELAESKGQRIHTDRDPNSVKEELKFLEEKLQGSMLKIKSKNQYRENWERAQYIADTIEQDIRVAGKLINTLEPAIVSQEKRFEKKKYDFGNALQTCFLSLISSRNFGGRLVIDHNERNLMFWVCPDSNSEDRAKTYNEKIQSSMKYNKRMRDYISGLSGGEKSFSTICFLVSMWKTMEAPFYILDEFDVFMDPANRKASQLILNAHTRNQPEAQFIFITPRAQNTLIIPENCKVLRLYPPIRDLGPIIQQEEPRKKLKAITMGDKEENKRPARKIVQQR